MKIALLHDRPEIQIDVHAVTPRSSISLPRTSQVRGLDRSSSTGQVFMACVNARRFEKGLRLRSGCKDGRLGPCLVLELACWGCSSAEP